MKDEVHARRSALAANVDTMDRRSRDPFWQRRHSPEALQQLRHTYAVLSEKGHPLRVAALSVWKVDSRFTRPKLRTSLRDRERK